MQREDIIASTPGLARSDYFLFGPMKESLTDKYYVGDEEVKTTVIKWLKKQSTEFYKAEIHALFRGWNIATERNGDNQVNGISTGTLHQSTNPFLSQTIWPIWASRLFLSFPIV